MIGGRWGYWSVLMLTQPGDLTLESLSVHSRWADYGGTKLCLNEAMGF